MTKTIFFDIGGTLMDSYNDLFDEILSKLYLNKNEFEQKKNRFLENFNILKNLCTKNNFKITKELLNESFRKTFPDSEILPSEIYSDIYINKIYLFDKVKETLKYLRNKGYKLIVVSDADDDILIPQLKGLGIYGYFEAFIISSQVKGYKPTNPIIDEINKYINSNKNKLYFIGDSEVDIQTAKKISAISILINPKGKYLNFNQDYSIKNIKEIIDIIQ